jgi:hypothetical protein
MELAGNVSVECGAYTEAFAYPPSRGERALRKRRRPAPGRVRYHIQLSAPPGPHPKAEIHRDRPRAGNMAQRSRRVESAMRPAIGDLQIAPGATHSWSHLRPRCARGSPWLRAHGGGVPMTGVSYNQPPADEVRHQIWPAACNQSAPSREAGTLNSSLRQAAARGLPARASSAWTAGLYCTDHPPPIAAR